MNLKTVIRLFLLLACGFSLLRAAANKEGTAKQITLVSKYDHDDGTNSCVTLDQQSIEKFAKWTMDEDMKLISFNLSFTEIVNSSSSVFIPYQWVWTYSRMQESAFNMIQFPFDFDLLSCGLLSNHMKRYRPFGSEVDQNVSVNINVTREGCLPPLGTNETDIILQKLFQKLVYNTYYVNNSLFCYEVLNNVTETMGTSWTYLTHFFGLQKDYTGYKCCPTPEVNLGCSITVQQTNFLWIIPIYAILIAVFSPLMLGLCPESPSNMRKHNHRVLPEEEGNDLASEMPMIPDKEWVYLGDDRFTFVGFFKRTIICKSQSSVVKRIRRIMFIHLSLIVILFKTLLYYLLKSYSVKKRIDRDIPIGGLCMPFGLQACLKNSWYFLGSPIIYIPLYLLLGSIIICLPNDIPQLFLSSKELSNEAQMQIKTFLYLTDGLLECRTIVRNHNHLQGYKKLAAKLQDRFSMLLTKQFWKLFFKVWSYRFSMLNFVEYFSYAAPRGQFRYILMAFTVLPTAICWLLLLTMAMLELFLIICYYGFPIVFFLKLQFSGFLSLTFQVFSTSLNTNGRPSCLLLPLIGIASIIIFIVLFFVLFVGIFQFIVSFNFFLHMVYFTFAGVVVNPEIALTYFLAALAIIYYVIKCFSSVSEGYTMLLSVMIKVSKALAEEEWRPVNCQVQDEEHRYCYIKENPDTGMLGVPKEAFDGIIETCRPFRMQIFTAFIKLFITGNIIYSSVTLIQTFHNQDDNVYFSTKTLAVIFIVYLPQLLGIFNSRENIKKEKFEKYISGLTKDYWHQRLQIEASAQLE